MGFSWVGALGIMGFFLHKVIVPFGEIFLFWGEGLFIDIIILDFFFPLPISITGLVSVA